VTEGDPVESEVLRRLESVRRLIEEAHTMTETVWRLEEIAKKLQGDVEFADEAKEIMDSLSFVVTLISELQASQRCLEQMLETARSYTARRREYTRTLLTFSGLVEQAAEMVLYRIPADDTAESATGLLEAAPPLVEELSSFPPEVTIAGSADEKRQAALIEEWEGHVPALRSIASGEQPTEEELEAMEKGPASAPAPEPEAEAAGESAGSTALVTHEVEVEVQPASPSGPFAFFARAFSRPAAKSASPDPASAADSSNRPRAQSMSG